MHPLVVTLALEAGAQERFDAERARWFPADRSEVGAHVTLFQCLRGELEERVRVDLVQHAGPPFPVGVAGVLPLSGGTAYALAAPELARRQRVLQQLWWAELTAQDRQGFRPHITVQQQVSAAEARATVTVLRRAFRPFQFRAEGYRVWRNNDGPWTELARIPFAETW
ncbi:MAG TPA: 2'-5' RNA ligase family protein [Jatrophihabitans sp.]|nr:2'-5' RNA ligase family protein [Jatrophihabitans sp.]